MRKATSWLLPAALLIALTAAGCGGTSKTGVPVTTAAAPSISTPPASFPDEGVTETTTPAVAGGKVGQVVELSDETGPISHVVVTKVKFNSGDEFNRPERGQFLGVYVKIRALADNQTNMWGDFYVTMRGHHYDGDAYAEGFTPGFDYVDLNKGETSEGWLIFDVPARHGQVVLVNSMDDNSKLASWSF